eukprot:PhF_6_TR42769/c0_g1_i1/m.64687/K01887/RARS, argS; arginyl-tRNA synthetase
MRRFLPMTTISAEYLEYVQRLLYYNVNHVHQAEKKSPAETPAQGKKPAAKAAPPEAPAAPARDLSKEPRSSLKFATEGAHLERSIASLLRQAFLKAFPTFTETTVPKVLIAPSRNHDFQCNNSMAMGKLVSKPSQDVAKLIVDNIPPNDVFENFSIDKDGFIFMNITSQYLVDSVEYFHAEGIKHQQPRMKVAVDFSSPNIAKDMHVGHLRSTIIGDCICRVHEFCGHEVLRINHVGDWGTQFGMLIAYMKQEYPNCLKVAPPIKDLAAFYKRSKVEFDGNAEFKAKAYQEVVALQSGNSDAVAAWKLLCDVSRAEFQTVYQRLGVTLTECGESFYKDKIPGVLKMVQDKGIVTTLKDGAQVIMPSDVKALETVTGKEIGRIVIYNFREFATETEFRNFLAEKGIIKGDDIVLSKKETKKVAEVAWAVDGEKIVAAMESLIKNGASLDKSLLTLFQAKGIVTPDGKQITVPRFQYPLIVVKRDGGFTYDTTDLAAVWYRTQVLKADKIVVITDVGQAGHFELINAVADIMGWTENRKVEHVGFGLVTGLDGKRFRTRSTDTVRLADLMDEAVFRCLEISEKREAEHPQGFGEDLLKKNAEILGIAAIKYCDLKQNRASNYAFSFDKMCELDGNTALYLLYTYVRICGIFRKAASSGAPVDLKGPLDISNPTSRALALFLCRFQAHLDRCMDENMPSRITDFAYGAVCKFTDFYGKVQVVGNPSALKLVSVTGNVLKTSLALLGIDVVERL